MTTRSTASAPHQLVQSGNNMRRKLNKMTTHNQEEYGACFTMLSRFCRRGRRASCTMLPQTSMAYYWTLSLSKVLPCQTCKAAGSSASLQGELHCHCRRHQGDVAYASIKLGSTPQDADALYFLWREGASAHRQLCTKCLNTSSAQATRHAACVSVTLQPVEDCGRLYHCFFTQASWGSEARGRVLCWLPQVCGSTTSTIQLARNRVLCWAEAISGWPSRHASNDRPVLASINRLFSSCWES